jgi:hypothetical protein
MATQKGKDVRVAVISIAFGLASALARRDDAAEAAVDHAMWGPQHKK